MDVTGGKNLGLQEETNGRKKMKESHRIPAETWREHLKNVRKNAFHNITH